MRVLMVLLPGRTAADQAVLRIGQFVEPYYIFHDVAVEVVLASPAGGYPGLERESAEPEQASPSLLRFRADLNAREALSDTLTLDQIFPDDFDGAFCFGAPGPITGGGPAAALLAAFFAVGKPVAVVPSALDLLPDGINRGLLITGSGADTPARAAHALLAALRE